LGTRSASITFATRRSTFMKSSIEIRSSVTGAAACVSGAVGLSGVADAGTASGVGLFGVSFTVDAPIV
jgi:hypothetical protein